MIEQIKVKDIKPNPFQYRSVINEATIAELASEIDNVGLWVGALRGRRNNGNVELCSGHRRLAAIRKLGWKTVDVEIVKLDDKEMAAQSLIENLQREGLNDIDKAEGIEMLVKELCRDKSRDLSIAKASEMLGLSKDRIRVYLQMAGFTEAAKQPIRSGAIAGRPALEAYHFGGAEMIHTAAKKELSLHAMADIAQTVRSVENKAVQEQLKREVISGKITHPDKARERKEELILRTVKKSKQKEPPPDLMVVITNWTGFIDGWTEQLEGVQPYIEYIDRTPKIADKFRVSVRRLIKALEGML